MANLKSTTIADTGFLQLPSGTTAQRPASPTAGEIRFNTDTKGAEWYDDQLAAWFPTGVVPPVATGGDTVEDLDIDGVTYRIHRFTSVGSNTLNLTRSGAVEYLVVAGGGAGGPRHGGGGGAGGLLSGSMTLQEGSYDVFVGAGGEKINTDIGRGYPGQNSFFGNINAVGGGGGGVWDGSPAQPEGGSGGSGGGASGGSRAGNRVREPGGTGMPGQGHNGGSGIRYLSDGSNAHAGGGGGGAGTPGANGQDDSSSPSKQTRNGNGGDGVFTEILGTGYFFAGGGGGGIYSGSLQAGNGGLGGGGGGGTHTTESSESFGIGDTASINPGQDGGQAFGGDAGDNTGGGGGANGGQSQIRVDSGSGSSPGEGGSGGSGIVIIRYRIS